MTSFNKRVYEMLIRVLVFAQHYRQYFEKGSWTAKLLEMIQDGVNKLTGHKNAQASGKGDTKRSTEERAVARIKLSNHLDTISRTAKSLNLSNFWLSRDKSDRSLVEMGHMFVSRAEALKELFIESYMPLDFIEQLKGAVEDLEKTIRDQVFKEGARITATSGIDSARILAVEALDRLIPAMENLLKGEPEVLRLWQTACHVERYTRRKRKGAAPPAEVPPVIDSNSISNADAAQA